MADGRFQTIDLSVESSFADILAALGDDLFFGDCKCPWCDETKRRDHFKQMKQDPQCAQFHPKLRLQPAMGMKDIMSNAKAAFEYNVEVSDRFDECVQNLEYLQYLTTYSMGPEEFAGLLSEEAYRAGEVATQALLQKIEHRLEDLLCWAFKMSPQGRSSLLATLLEEAMLWAYHLGSHGYPLQFLLEKGRKEKEMSEWERRW